jgi:hypothetical protein
VLYLNKIAWNTIRLEKGTAYVWSSEVLTLSVRFSIFALSPALTLNLLFYFILWEKVAKVSRCEREIESHSSCLFSLSLWTDARPTDRARHVTVEMAAWRTQTHTDHIFPMRILRLTACLPASLATNFLRCLEKIMYAFAYAHLIMRKVVVFVVVCHVSFF